MSSSGSDAATSLGDFSIARRLSILVIGVCVAGLAVHVVHIARTVRPLMDEVLLRVADETILIRSVLQAAPEAQRDTLAKAMTRSDLGVSKAGDLSTEDPEMPPPMPPPRVLADRLGADVVVALDPPHLMTGGMHIGFMVDREMWWVHHRMPGGPGRSAIWPAMAAWTLVGLTGVGVAWWGRRWITKPLAELADEMRARRSHLRPIRVGRGASTEVIQVVTAFNDLVGALRRSQQSQRSLLAGVSHDLRTPLARLRLRAELECPEAAFQAMEPDFLAVTHIIEQFLAYAQSEMPAEGGRLRPLKDLLEEVVAGYRRDAREVSLGDVVSGETPVLPMAWQRILHNLIDNALSHGQAPVTVTVAQGAAGALTVLVWDRGLGIAAKDLSHALLPFSKLSARDSAEGHCGLGLAIVAQITQRLGGEVVCRPFDGERSAIGVALRSEAESGACQSPRAVGVMSA